MVFNRFMQACEKNEHMLIGAILTFAFVLRAIVLIYYGWDLSINSDDAGYVRSAKALLERGMLTYHVPNDTPTVHIMPGQPFLLASLFLVFGTGMAGIVAGKLLFILLGVANVYWVYLIGRHVGNLFIGLLSALLLAGFLPQILTDNLLLTETPFMFCLLAMIYFSIRLANEHKWRHFYLLMATYLGALFFKATIALFPILLLIYFIRKKYPFGLALKQFGVACILLLVVLGPWWVRNYHHYGEFIPLTGGAGDPLLMGTYQGDGAYLGDPYAETVNRIKREHPEVSNAYEKLKVEAEIAKGRMLLWWEKDKKSFLRTYLVTKPKLQWDGQFYRFEIYSVTKVFMDEIHNRIVGLALLSLIVVLFMRKIGKEYEFLLGFIVYNTVLNSVYYAFDRYNQPLMFILFLMISTAAYQIMHVALDILLPFVVKKLQRDKASAYLKE
jgi:4-amino-4-deoxy-L-arabinose transferase-like glycosyltransferase